MKIFSISQNDANQRLDKFLKKLLPNSSLSLIYKLNRKNKIKVNGKKLDNEYKLQVGDEIKVFLLDKDFEILTQIKPSIILSSTKKLDKKNIIYEDSELLIINKDPGVIVHPGDYKTKEISLIQQVHDYLGNKLNSLTFRPSLIHRIDKDTSGIVMIAKTKEALDFMIKELQNDKIEKLYLAICAGNFKEKSGVIKIKLRRIDPKIGAQNENKVQIDEKLGQKAITYYTVLQDKINLKYSLVECKLETGRTHQIRVHLSYIGNPIIGDKIYGDKKENAFLERNFGVARQFLHAYKISFTHPKKKVRLTLEARLKDDMYKFLNG